MTRVLIKMTNDEINEAVAKRLGKTRPKFIHPLTGVHEMPFPNYCGDIGAAWEIFEFLDPIHNEDHFSIRKTFDKRRRWCVRLKGATAYADTAPMAICKAFLKLEGSNGSN